MHCVKRGVAVLVGCVIVGVALGGCAAHDPLPSWNEGATKTAIVEFVEAVTDPASPDYVEPEARIATFDNDGTLWVEQPMYTQVLFAFERVKEMAPDHPEWRTEQPFKALLAGDMQEVAKSGEEGLLKIVIATHSGMTEEEFEQEATAWLASAKQKRFKHLYTECVYQPQLELLQYLEDEGFTTYIVSGGGMQFMRPWTDRVYGIPRERVVGSRIQSEYVMKDGRGQITRSPKIGFVDDKVGKPVGIHERIGRHPILAFGNSDGDIEMLQYTTTQPGRQLGLFVHHDDAKREYAYDRKSHVGTLNKGLDMAKSNGWILVSMKDDWAQIFPWEETAAEER